MFLNGRMPTIGISQRPTAILVCKSGYAALVSLTTRDPVWSAEHLTPAGVAAAHRLSRLQASFFRDPDLPVGQAAAPEDYLRSGWDRGHMSPDGDMPTIAAQRESFDLGNVVPQAAHLNRGAWEQIERTVRGLASTGEMYVVTGPLISDPIQTIGPDAVVIPTATWKAIYLPASRYGRGWICTNVQDTYCAPIALEALEQQIHINLFPGSSTEKPLD